MPGVLAWESPGGGHYCVPHRAQEASQRVPYEGLVGSESTLGTLAQVPILAQAPSELVEQMRRGTTLTAEVMPHFFFFTPRLSSTPRGSPSCVRSAPWPPCSTLWSLGMMDTSDYSHLLPDLKEQSGWRDRVCAGAASGMVLHIDCWANSRVHS